MKIFPKLYLPEGEGAAGSGTAGGAVEGAGASAGAAGAGTAPPVTDFRTFIDDKGTITKPAEFFKLAGAEHLSKRFTTLEGFAKSYVNAERMLSNGNKVAVPGDTSTAEEWDAYFKAIGRPETADKYEIAVPDEIKGIGPLDEAGLKDFREVAYKAGLTPKQMAALTGWYFPTIAKGIEAENTARQARFDAAVADLAKEWGPAESAKHKEQLALAEKGAAHAGLTAEVLKSTPELSNNPHFIRAMAKVGATIGERGTSTQRQNNGQDFGSDVREQINAIIHDPKHAYYGKDPVARQAASEKLQGLYAKLHPEPAQR